MAFKASPSSQHQHCTDEAQKAETVLSAVISIYLYIYIYIIKKKYIKPVQHTLKGFRVFLHNKFRKPVKGKNRELRLVFLTDINNSASFIGISRRIPFSTTDYCSLTMRVFIEFRS